MTEGKYRLDLDKIPITLATLSQMEVMRGFHERFSWIIIPIKKFTFLFMFMHYRGEHNIDEAKHVLACF